MFVWLPQQMWIFQNRYKKGNLERIYFIGWILAASIDLLVLYLCTDIIEIYYLYSQIIWFCISFIFAFLFQKYITFSNSTNQFLREGLLFFLFQIIGLWINLLILQASVEIIWLHYLLWSIIAKWVVFLRNFSMNNIFNFKLDAQ